MSPEETKADRAGMSHVIFFLSGVAVGVQEDRQPLCHQSPEEGRHRCEGWGGKVAVCHQTMLGDLNLKSPPHDKAHSPHKYTSYSNYCLILAPPAPALCLSPVWCVRSGSLRPSTVPTTRSWSTCLHASRRPNMCVLSWSTQQEETSWCTYMPTFFLSHVLCEFRYAWQDTGCVSSGKFHCLCFHAFINAGRTIGQDFYLFKYCLSVHC